MKTRKFEFKKVERGLYEIYFDMPSQFDPTLLLRGWIFKTDTSEGPRWRLDLSPFGYGVFDHKRLRDARREVVESFS